MCCTNSPGQSRIAYDPVVLHPGPCPALTMFSNLHTHPSLLTLFLRGFLLLLHAINLYPYPCCLPHPWMEPKSSSHEKVNRPPQYTPPQPASIRTSWIICTDVQGCIETNACFELHWHYPHFCAPLTNDVLASKIIIQEPQKGLTTPDHYRQTADKKEGGKFCLLLLSLPLSV